MTSPAIRELVLADPPAAWTELGFAVEDGRCRVGDVTLTLGAPAFAWTLGAVDGLPSVEPSGAAAAPAAHPNGALVVDHVVVATPDLDRTLAALAQAGFDLRRTRDTEMDGRPLRQAFYRAGEPVLEVVGPPGAAGEGPARFWGLTITVADLHGLAERLGDRLGPVHDAVQPGRRIASFARWPAARHPASPERPALASSGCSAGLGTRLAFMSP